jgi:AsmA protein
MRWIVRGILAALVAIVLVFGAIALIPSERIAAIAVQQFDKVTGRKLTIEGAIKPTIWPVLGVRTGRVTLSNAEWSDAGPMLVAEGLSIQIDMATLLGGQVHITGLEALGPTILLERAADGRENWVFGGSNGGTAQADMAGADTPFTLDKGEVKDGALRFIDHASGQTVNLTAVNAEAKLSSYDGPATVSLNADMAGQKIALTGTVDEFSRFYKGGVVPVDMALTAGAAKVGFRGRMGAQPLAGEGDLTADLADLAAVSALAGMARPGLPEGLGARKVVISGALTITPEGSYHLRQGKITLDGNEMTADADLTLAGQRPKLVAKLDAGALNLAALTGGGGGAGGPAAAAPAGWPKDRIDASGLGALDADMAIRAGSIDLGMVRLGAAQAKVTIDAARAVVDLSKVAAYGGTVSGQAIVNARKGLSVAGDLMFSGIALQDLLRDAAGYERLVGSGDLRLKWLGSGTSVDALMKGMSGSGSVALGKGEIIGLDIAGMLRTLDTSYVGPGQKTIFDQLSASFAIDKGNLRSDDLALTSPYLTTSGAGRVGLGQRDIDYKLRPTLLPKADGTGGVSVPLMITGPWSDLRFALDMAALAQEKLGDQAKALEEKAKAKAAEALGVAPGTDLEKAAKRKARKAAQDAAKKAGEQLLQDLLNGN